MNQRNADHRPAHGGYPATEEPPFIDAGPGRRAPTAAAGRAALVTRHGVAITDPDQPPHLDNGQQGDPLADRIRAELAAGAATVRIDAIDPADVDYVPADMLVLIDPPGVREVAFSVEGDPDDWAAGDTRELSPVECEAIIASLADTDPRSLPREGESLREHAQRLLRKPTGVWLDELLHYPSDEAFAALESHDRARRGTATHPTRGVEPGFAHED